MSRPLFLLSLVLFGCPRVVPIPTGEESDTDTDADADADTDTDTDTDVDVVPTSECQSSCSAKAEACGAPAAGAQQVCASDICSNPVTRTQLNCHENTACGDLISAIGNGDAVCGIGDDAPTGECDCGAAPGVTEPTLYGLCEGSSNGCEGTGSAPFQGCLYQRSSGLGDCYYPCDASDEGSQGSCPSGLTCRDSDRTTGIDDSGDSWFVCR